MIHTVRPKRRRACQGISLLAGALVSLLSPLGAAEPPSAAAAPTAIPRLGINLAGPADWNTELPFVDVFRFSRPWASQHEGAPWFCMPHLADDDYVRHFAQMVKDRLDPRLAIYVEYSNEVWNGQFVQHHYAGEQGIKLGFAEKPWEAAWRYTARRSVEIFRIWEEVFGGRARLVRVLASQAANPYVAEQILTWEDAYRHADALAIAPYISCNVHPSGDRLDAATVRGWTVDQALDYMERTALPEAIDWIAGNKAVADRYGLKLVAYEAGQHMVGVGGAENDEALTRLLHAANAHPRMGDIYRRYYAAWARAGGDLLCHFSSVGRWSKWGSWGLLEYADDDPRTSPKFVATMEWGAERNRPDPTPTR